MGLALLVAAWGAPSSLRAEPLSWTSLDTGLAVTVWRPGETCPDVDGLLIVDIDPESYQFAVHNYADEGLKAPVMLEQWRLRTGHVVLFNAGLFTPDLAYMGLLSKDGRILSRRQHPSWHGLFVAEPESPHERTKARIVDLREAHPERPTRGYREAAQALMLIDRVGTIRVRHTGKFAHQTIIAETREGHIRLVKTLGLVTLYGIAECLRGGLTDISVAMAMDGGSSSDLLVAPSVWKAAGLSDREQTWKELFAGGSTAHIPLPTVIGLSRRGTAGVTVPGK